MGSYEVTFPVPFPLIQAKNLVAISLIYVYICLYSRSVTIIPCFIRESESKMVFTEILSGVFEVGDLNLLNLTES